MAPPHNKIKQESAVHLTITVKTPIKAKSAHKNA